MTTHCTNCNQPITPTYYPHTYTPHLCKTCTQLTTRPPTHPNNTTKQNPDNTWSIKIGRKHYTGQQLTGQPFTTQQQAQNYFPTHPTRTQVQNHLQNLIDQHTPIAHIAKQANLPPNRIIGFLNGKYQLHPHRKQLLQTTPHLPTTTAIKIDYCHLRNMGLTHQQVAQKLTTIYQATPTQLKYHQKTYNKQKDRSV